MIIELEKALSEITGFAATSLQPNSGAQGSMPDCYHPRLPCRQQWATPGRHADPYLRTWHQSCQRRHGGMKVVVVKAMRMDISTCGPEGQGSAIQG